MVIHLFETKPVFWIEIHRCVLGKAGGIYAELNSSVVA